MYLFIKQWKRRVSLLLTLTIILLSCFAAAHAAEDAEADTGTTEASVEFSPGELKLNSVPVLDFGVHTISAEENTYPAESVSAPIQVSDLRGSGSGWKLVAALSPFALDGTGVPTLQAAAIHVTSQAVSAVNGNVGTPPTAVPNVVLQSNNDDTLILRANAGEGMGVWNLVWSPANVGLLVKAGTAQTGRSVATLHWSLQSAP